MQKPAPGSACGLPVVGTLQAILSRVRAIAVWLLCHLGVCDRIRQAEWRAGRCRLR